MTRPATFVSVASLAIAACTGPEQPSPVSEYWSNLTALCGQAYAGTVAEAPAGDTTFANKALIMHVSACDSSEIRIPFHVGEDRSRTWVFTRTTDGVRLKHDHRHPDGTEDSVSQYGGDARLPGQGVLMEYPADSFTKALIPAAATNVWTVEIQPSTRFAYALRREGTDRRFRIEFDLTQPVPIPKAAGQDEHK